MIVIFLPKITSIPRTDCHDKRGKFIVIMAQTEVVAGFIIMLNKAMFIFVVIF